MKVEALSGGCVVFIEGSGALGYFGTAHVGDARGIFLTERRAIAMDSLTKEMLTIHEGVSASGIGYSFPSKLPFTPWNFDIEKSSTSRSDLQAARVRKRKAGARTSLVFICRFWCYCWMVSVRRAVNNVINM